MKSSTSISYFYSGQNVWPNQTEIETMISWDKAYFPTPWTDKQWFDLGKEEDYLLALTSQGFALFKLFKIEGLAHLLKVVTLPESRGQGLGKALLQDSLLRICELGLQRFYLEVEEGNLPAQKLYQSLGFKNLHLIKNFYGQGRHAWTMGLDSP